MNITEFLLARIAEDEAVASSATAGPWRWDADFGDGNDTGLALTNDAEAEIVSAYNFHCCSFRDDPRVEPDDAVFIARHDPARVLAECAAKRAILSRVPRPTDPYDPGGYTSAHTLRALAAVYEDHPDYQTEWAL